MELAGVGRIINTVSSPVGYDKNNNIDKDNNVVAKFGEYLNNAINKVNDLQIESSTISNDSAKGLTDNIHEVMIAAEKASIALQFTMQVRNKILDAYNDIMKMQI